MNKLEQILIRYFDFLERVFWGYFSFLESFRTWLCFVLQKSTYFFYYVL